MLLHCISNAYEVGHCCGLHCINHWVGPVTAAGCTASAMGLIITAGCAPYMMGLVTAAGCTGLTTLGVGISAGCSSKHELSSGIVFV